MKVPIDAYAQDALRALWDHYYKMGWQAAIDTVLARASSLKPFSYPGPIPRNRSLVNINSR